MNEIKIKCNNKLTKTEFSLVKDCFENDKSIIVVYKCKLIEFLMYLLKVSLCAKEWTNNLHNLIHLKHYIPYNHLSDYNGIVNDEDFTKHIGQFLAKEVLVQFKPRYTQFDFLNNIIKFPEYLDFFNFPYDYYSVDLGFKRNLDLITNTPIWFNIYCIDVETRINLPFILHYSGELPGCNFNYVRLDPSKYCNKNTYTFTEPAILKMFMGLNRIHSYLSSFSHLSNLKEKMLKYKCFPKNGIEISQNIRDRIYLRVDNKIYSYYELYNKLSDIDIKLLI